VDGTAWRVSRRESAGGSVHRTVEFDSEWQPPPMSDDGAEARVGAVPAFVPSITDSFVDGLGRLRVGLREASPRSVPVSAALGEALDAPPSGRQESSWGGVAMHTSARPLNSDSEGVLTLWFDELDVPLGAWRLFDPGGVEKRTP
jgi:hypothetical protein